MKPQEHENRIDIVIIGGGIAGLWLLNRVLDAGYQAVLIEKDKLGGIQTLASQGMIHGGQKYTLTGKTSKKATNIAEMPVIWSRCLRGTGDIDLSAVKLLSDYQLMWAGTGFASKAGVFAAAKAVNSETKIAKKEDIPEFLQSFTTYRMNECVLDMKSLISVLVNKNKEHIFKGEVTVVEENDFGLRIKIGNQEINSKYAIFTAGMGNEDAVRAIGIEGNKTQRRPLKQIMVRGMDHSLYGHCIVVNPKPRATITAHPYKDKYVWYIGGAIAEKSVNLSDEEAIKFAKSEMQEIIPEMSWEGLEWSVWSGDRAEPFSYNGRLPEGAYFFEHGRSIISWPVKLTFTPALANNILACLQNKKITKSNCKVSIDLPSVEIGSYPWENAKWQIV